MLLADYFVRALGARMGGQEPGLSGEARERLLRIRGPGTSASRRNAIERVLVLAQGELIWTERLGIVPRAPHSVSVPVGSVPESEAPTTALTIREQEKRMIAEALRRTAGKKAHAAALLGLSRTQLSDAPAASG